MEQSNQLWERQESNEATAINRGICGILSDLYMPASEFDALPLPMLIDRYESMRRSTLALLRSLPPGAWTRWGNASGADVTVLALAFIIAGHELHHMNVVAERYSRSERG